MIPLITFAVASTLIIAMVLVENEPKPAKKPVPIRVRREQPPQ